jgi:hypothetical protein
MLSFGMLLFIVYLLHISYLFLKSHHNFISSLYKKFLQITTKNEIISTTILRTVIVIY